MNYSLLRHPRILPLEHLLLSRPHEPEDFEITAPMRLPYRFMSSAASAMLRQHVLYTSASVSVAVDALARAEAVCFDVTALYALTR